MTTDKEFLNNRCHVYDVTQFFFSVTLFFLQCYTIFKNCWVTYICSNMIMFYDSILYTPRKILVAHQTPKREKVMTPSELPRGTQMIVIITTY